MKDTCIKVLFISETNFIWQNDLFLSLDKFDNFALSPSNTSIPTFKNPYQLPEAERADVAVVCSNWLQVLYRDHPAEARSTLEQLRQRVDRLVILEGFYAFHLLAPPEAIELADLVIKAQGLYRDRALYNREVGALYPGLTSWQNSPTAAVLQYTPAQLDKLRPGAPCMLGAAHTIRRRSRKVHRIPLQKRLVYATLDRLLGQAYRLGSRSFRSSYEVHALGSLTHIRRLELVRRLKQLGVSGDFSLTIPKNRWVFGIDYYPHTLTSLDSLTEARIQALQSELDSLGVKSLRFNRLEYLVRMLQHQLVAAPSGYGELSFRIAEAWAMAKAVLVEDLSHVEIQFPIADRRNALYIKPDYSNLEQLIQELRSGAIDALALGQQAHTDWVAYCQKIPQELHRLYVAPIQQLVIG